MKIFISADIEGCSGVAISAETHKNEPVYQRFADRMTEEVVAVCEAALEAGADEIYVKDGHGDATNINPLAMPEGVTLIRGKSGHPINMMFGLDETFDAVMYIGYHAPAGDGGSPLSHTSTGNSNFITLNGNRMSEFMLNSYTAGMFHVPVIFISGDQRICDLAKEQIPDIHTVATKRGEGASAFQVSPATVLKRLKEETKKAIQSDFNKCRIELPKSFEYEVNYKDLKKAYQMSFYPGMKKIDDRTNRLTSENYMDIVTAHSFVVY